MVAATVAVRWLLSSSGTTSTTSAPARSRPRQPRMSASACAEVGPPTSGVPTAGAKPGSTKSTSTVTNALASPTAVDGRGDHAGAELREVVPGDHGEAELPRLLVLVGRVEPAAHAEEGRARRVDHTLLQGAADHRAVDVPLAGALVEAVRVRAEVQQRDRAVLRGGGAQLGQGDRVVAADAQRHRAGAVHLAQRLLHGGQAAVGEAAGDRPHVAGVDHREPLEHGDPLRGVVRRVDGQGRLAHRAGPEAGARAHGEAGVEREADHGHVHAVELRDVGQPQERGDAGDPRRARAAVRAVSLHHRLPRLECRPRKSTVRRRPAAVLPHPFPHFADRTRARASEHCGMPADRQEARCRTRGSAYW